MFRTQGGNGREGRVGEAQGGRAIHSVFEGVIKEHYLAERSGEEPSHQAVETLDRIMKNGSGGGGELFQMVPGQRSIAVLASTGVRSLPSTLLEKPEWPLMLSPAGCFPWELDGLPPRPESQGARDDEVGGALQQP